MAEEIKLPEILIEQVATGIQLTISDPGLVDADGSKMRSLYTYHLKAIINKSVEVVATELAKQLIAKHGDLLLEQAAERLERLAAGAEE